MAAHIDKTFAIDATGIEAAGETSVDLIRDDYYRKQADLLYENAGLALFGVMSSALLVGYYFFNYSDPYNLLAWFTATFVVSLLRYLTVFARNASLVRLSDKSWTRAFEIGTAFSGLAWGSAALTILPPGSFSHHAILAFVIGGLSAGTVAIYTASRYAAPLFMLFAGLPLLYSLHINPETLALPMEVLTFMYLLAMVVVSARIYAATSERIRLDLQNKGLISYLTESLGEMDGLNMLLREEIKNRVRVEERLSYEASHDSLTGLINRREFESRLLAAIDSAEQSDKQHALMFVDLDQFKVVNDTCGHMAGDELLKQVATTLVGHIRDTDAMARLGGDEFGILLENCPLEKAENIAETLRTTIRSINFAWEDKAFDSSASIGLVPITRTTGNLAELMKMADTACYISKEQGRNRIHVLSEDDTEVAQRQGELQWVHGIREAINDDRIVLFVQEIRSLDPAVQDRHYEILMRMESIEGELIAPMAYIPAAERYDMMPALDRHVIRKAFAYMKRLAESGKQRTIFSINLSGQSLCNDDFLGIVVDELTRSEVDPEDVCFEVTETTAIGNLARARQFMSILKGMGCQFSLDDFGSGLSSFGYLKNLDVDFLKIDGAFVRDMANDKVDEAMVQSINQVGHVLGMKTIAEFVENDETIEKLRSMGIDYAQGYGVERPHRFEDLFN